MRHELAFLRQEGLRVPTVAFVVVYTTREPQLAIEEAVNLWAKTPEGKEAWFRSGEDYNIGDLAYDYESIPGRIWEQAGISSIEIQVVSTRKAINFDRVLMTMEDDA